MKKNVKFIIPSLITLLILLIIFYIQGLYPFTNNSIVQVDADFQYIPVLYRIYDFLHGNANIIYDDIGLGNNIYTSMIIQGSIFSPISLLLYLTSRSNIVNFFNIIVIVKICLISLTSYIYINHNFKIKEYYKVVFSILYAFSGWILLNYFNIMWLDSIILFPLIIMYLNDLLKKEKYLGYIITLSLSIIISFYISYFILLFILFYSLLYIFIYTNKKKIKKTIFNLVISTIIAILLSSFSSVPAVYQTLISSRIGSSYTNGILTNFQNKSLFLMLSTIFLVIFTMLIPKLKDKNVKFYLILFALFSIGLFVEPINLAFHMGSYWSFPYRYSFITLFILLNGCLYYISKYDIKGNNKYQIIKIIIFFLLAISLIYLNNLFYNSIIDSQIVLDFNNIEVYKKILIIFLIIVIMTIISINFKNKYLKYTLFSIVCLLQIYIYSSWTMYYSSGYFLSKQSNEINDNMNIINSDLERYKMGYTTYTPDYSFMYNVNTLDNWLHILPNNMTDIYRKLGYMNTDSCIRSYGGTIFSDWLFNVRYLIDTEENNNDMYNLLDNYHNFYLYEYNYNNGFGIIYNKDINDKKYDKLNGFKLQNMIYKELFDKKEDIIKIDNYIPKDSSMNVIINYEITEKGFLYINLYDEIDYIKVNNKNINFENINYIIDLGLYKEDLVIEVGLYNEPNYLDFDLGFIKYKDIINLNTNVNKVNKLHNGYEIEVFNELDNGYLFLPINNINGLNAYINGNKVNIDSYINNFVSVKLEKGNNKININYEMPLYKLGIILSILGIVLLTIFNKISSNKIILNITYYLYLSTALLLYIYLYIYSLYKYYG